MIITGIERNEDLAAEKAKLLGSLLYFTQVFFKLRTGRDFALSNPFNRESHHIVVCRQLTRVFRGEITRLLINLPPGHFKSTLLQHFVAWAWAHYPDSNFLYISYAHDEASKNTAVIKSIIELPQYQQFFGVKLNPAFTARDDFQTIQRGSCRAYGSEGAVTGKDAGFAGTDRFSGALIMDDMHKPDEVFSDAIRERVIRNYYDTISQRVRSPKVPRIFLGQCLHEVDIAAHFKSGAEGYEWEQIVLQGLDECGNALDPAVKTAEELKKMRENSPYVFYAQYQQDPQPPGGGIFKVENFYLIDDEPEILMTFLTVDTAETAKTHNDATVFSFWGIYKINDINRREIDKFALQWIDCVEMWIEPKNLKTEFLQFYGECCMHKVPPSFAAIERKSTGVTLISVLEDVRGLEVRNIERTKASNSKITRYLEIQPYINQKFVSLPRNGKHTGGVIDHCRKITANNSHRRDDIADTLYDAVKIALIDKTTLHELNHAKENNISAEIIQHVNRINKMRVNIWQK